MSVTLPPEQFKSLYPLNKLHLESLNELSEHMRLMHLRANRCLFRIGEMPSETFYLLEGIMQLVDSKQERFETVTPADQGEALPLPFMVPTQEMAKALVDSRILCVDREKLSELMARQQIAAPRHTPIHQAATGFDREEDLRRQFHALRQAQMERNRHAPGVLGMLDPFANSPGDENRAIVNQNSQGQVAATRARSWSRPDRTPMTEKLSASDDPDAIQRAFAAFGVLPGYAKLDVALRAQCLIACERQRYAPGDVVVCQGAKADYWYLVVEGECQVRYSDGANVFDINRYGHGGSFGEDGLVAGQPRNASVIAQTELLVLRMPKDEFSRLLAPALTRPVSFDELREVRHQDSVRVDVRMPSEKRQWRIPNALEIPHPVIRAHPFSGDPARSCVVICQDGRQSPAIAYMLSKLGFDAYFLSGGIAQIPESELLPGSTRNTDTPLGIKRLS